MANPTDVHRRLDEVQLVDVREAYEWDAGHIAGAVHIPLQSLLAGAERGRLDRSRPVVAICRAGNRSELATALLQARGYDAANMEGGMEAWARTGLPFEASDGGSPRVA
jgi:rhodanese-related sulfurtransferase